LYSENEHLLLLNCLYISWKRNRAGICDMHHVNFNQNQNIQICIRLDSAITMTIFSVILMTLNNWWSSKSAIQWTLLVQEQPHSFFFFLCYILYFSSPYISHTSFSMLILNPFQPWIKHVQ
jgi:hypothetical protein